MEEIQRGTSCCELVNPLAATPDRALFCPMAMGGTVAAPKGFVPLGAVGNAPVGTLFVGAVIDSWGVHSRNGIYYRVSPDLSSDKSPFVRGSI
ncbi:hypothetical protein OUZ56_014488 [Daphnia magna]|uniref:Uncharacterized protein n=1 Tax=Daphnia magna TaxID=35525 RepID=A0ABR0AJZ5_9CRUS|nr:hypothetical protein OUZ56_014488 [Daphnia magna]